jgi:hypothetical protein
MARIFAVAAALALAAAGCTSPHWSLPLPALDRVALSVAQSSARDVWIAGGALGSGGDALVLHYDGSAWQRLDPGTDATLWWVDAPDATTRWFVGERGTVLSGASLTVEPVPTTTTLYGVWQSASGTVWIVGGEPDLSGVVLRRVAGGAWQDVTPAGTNNALFKVWGAADEDVWICGQAGALLHWDGSTLTPVASGLPRSVSLFTVAGRDANDVYAVGGPATAVALHYDGTSWTQLTDAALATLPGLNGVAVDSDGTAILVGFGGTKLRGRPGAFADETALATRQDLHAASFVGGEIFAVGGNYLAPAPSPRTGVAAHFGGDISSTIK